MSLIYCPECNHEISDKAKYCIHCGFPLDNDDLLDCDASVFCLIKEKTYDLFEIKEKSLELSSSNYQGYNNLIKKLSSIACLTRRESACIIDYIRKTGNVPKTLDDAIRLSEETVSEHKNKIIKENTTSHTIRCPKCSSTQITTGSRGYSLAWGFIGANKTVNRCAKCGYSWQPKK